MKYERRQGQDDVPKNTGCYDGNGDICDDDIAAERKYDESGKEEEDGDEKEGRQYFDERGDVELVRAACKVLSDVCADMGWIIPSSKLTIPASPLLQHGSHEGASSAHVRLNTRLTNQTEFTSTTPTVAGS